VSGFNKIVSLIPGISEPRIHLSFKSRLKWTGIILILYLVLGSITIYGVAPQSYERFAFLEMILGANMGSLMTLGIGPIVMASIILQLLVGSGIIPWDLKTPDGRSKFQGTQKLLTIFFCVFEAYAYVSFGAVAPAQPTLFMYLVLIGQLAFGGFLVLLMDEVVQKWGIGSGVSLFIAAGVARTIFIGVFNPCVPVPNPVTGKLACGWPDPSAGQFPSGRLLQFFSYMQLGEMSQAVLAMLPIIATAVVFLVAIYIQAIRVDIPLAFATIRGFGRRWPLKFIYTSNIPVILAGALLANLQLIGPMLANRGIGIFGSFDSQGHATSGFLYFLSFPRTTSVQVFTLILLLVVFIGAFSIFYLKIKRTKEIMIISILLGFVLAVFGTAGFVGLPSALDFIRLITYLTFFVIFCTIFSVFWVNTSGMDAESVAGQIESMGMSIPGFRRDPRIIKQILNRYIPVLAVLGGLTIGMLAAVADFTNALGTGTGILLTVMILYNFYERIAQRYAEEIHPALRGLF